MEENESKIPDDTKDIDDVILERTESPDKTKKRDDPYMNPYRIGEGFAQNVGPSTWSDHIG